MNPALVGAALLSTEVVFQRIHAPASSTLLLATLAAMKSVGSRRTAGYAQANDWIYRYSYTNPITYGNTDGNAHDAPIENRLFAAHHAHALTSPGH
ncbi:hypothetical protein [Candidatus Amarolinea aalborgensis]|jgi:hypothetical protein|uniref:hypothetical protein n=1 Tax=Candidatus Amarolinea aalborgensis TaxID=2249329 RepID=UPI003BFA1424